MKKWSTRYRKCQSCKSDRFKYITRGYCIRCYRIIKKLEQVTKWDLANIETLKGYPHDMIFHTPDSLNRIKAGYIVQLKERLGFFKIREKQLNSPIYGIDIEYRLRNIAKQCHVSNKNLFFGIAGYIDHNFDMKQKKILYHLLNKIEENIPWKGIDWNRIFSD